MMILAAPFEIRITDSDGKVLLHVSSKDDGAMPFREVWPTDVVDNEVARSLLAYVASRLARINTSAPAGEHWHWAAETPSTGSGVKPPPAEPRTTVIELHDNGELVLRIARTGGDT